MHDGGLNSKILAVTTYEENISDTGLSIFRFHGFRNLIPAESDTFLLCQKKDNIPTCPFM